MRYLSFFFTIFILVTAFLLGAFSYVIHRQAIDFSALANYNPGQASVVLDDVGEVLCRFELDRREFVPLSAIPKHVQHAFIAAEDRDFFNHPGISMRSILRSLLVNLYCGRIVQGASTITQQLVKLLFFDSKKTFTRKIKEQIFALLIEVHFTKEHILQTYLNHVCFGCGIYGIEAAAQRFWGIHASELSVAQGATLAAIVNYPARYCPLTHGEASCSRRNAILRAMENLGFIDHVAAEIARSEKLVLIDTSGAVRASYIKESIRQFLEELVGKHRLYTGGLIIQTTISRTLQYRAECAFREHIKNIRGSLGVVDGALLSMDVSSGAIKVLIGGYDFKQSSYDRALTARRQMGSVFKPLVYAAAIAQGRTFADVEIDEPIELVMGSQVWRPKNNTEVFDGPMTLAHALSHSNNVVAVKTLLRTGIDTVVALARRMHIESEIRAVPSLALGCLDVTVKEVAAFFNVFANDGVYVAPYIIEWVKDAFGSKIYRAPDRKCERIVTSRVAGQVAKVLSYGVQRYLARYGITDFDQPIICKTGTTNDWRTCWFAGSSAAYTTVVYVGRDNNESLGRGVYPVWVAFPIWLSLYRSMQSPKTNFYYDPSLRPYTMHWKTGQPVSDHDSESVTIYV